MENKTSKTVYFFGAGASFASDFNLPMMKGFFRKEDFNSSNFSNLYKFIQEHFPNQQLSELNLEKVITFLELSIDKFGSFGEHPEVYLYEAKKEFDKYVNSRLKITAPEGCNKHTKIIKPLADKNSKDTIVTLNYDLVIDNTLYKLSPKKKDTRLLMEDDCLLNRMYDLLGRVLTIEAELPSLYHQHLNLGFYLKLHGSIDWLYCQNPACGNHQLFFPNRKGRPSNLSGDLCNLCGSPLIDVIIPPTMHKSFENFPKSGLLWSLAYRELKQADKIVLIGISLAESDYYLQWLITSSLRNSGNKTIEVVNNDQQVCEKLKRLTGINPIYKGDFDTYASSIN